MHRHSHLSSLRQSDSAANARKQRFGMTYPEGKLWYHLRARRLRCCKFRRQVPLGPYVADFLCEQKRVVIEVDGGSHAERVAHDMARTAWLEQRGYRVLRFWNNDVMGNIEGVLEEIARALA